MEVYLKILVPYTDLDDLVQYVERVDGVVCPLGTDLKMVGIADGFTTFELTAFPNRSAGPALNLKDVSLFLKAFHEEGFDDEITMTAHPV